MQTQSILIVEDNPLNMKLIKDVLTLTKYKFNILGAMDAETGIEIAREKSPDLILMDIELPGMDGLTAIKLLRKEAQFKNTPVVILSAYAMDTDREKGFSAGCDAYLSKPIDIEAFRKVVSSLINPDSQTKKIPRQDGRPPKILITDDDPINVKILTDQLQDKGYDTFHAFSGDTAVKLIKENTPDLILLDIVMPGMDGYDVTRLLKTNPDTVNIPIILITSLKDANDKARGLACGADEFIRKPICFAKLETRIQSLLRLKKYQEQLKDRVISEALMESSDQGKLQLRHGKDRKTILIIEDNPVDTQVLMDNLAELHVNINHVTNSIDAIRTIQKEKIDVVLLDILLPEKDGFAVCDAIKKNDLTMSIQVVMIICLQDLKSKIKGYNLGADDYLVKPVSKDELVVRVNSLLRKKDYLDKLRIKASTVLQTSLEEKATGIYKGC